MCKLYSKLYDCGHFKPDHWICKRVNRPRLVNAVACRPEPQGVSKVLHRKCGRCKARMELEWEDPAPVTRGASSRALGGYDESVPASNGRRVPAWAGRRSTLEDADKDTILAKLRPETMKSRKENRGDAARRRDQRPSQRVPEPVGALLQGKSLRRSGRSADLRADASRVSSDGRTGTSRDGPQRRVARVPSRAQVDREELPSYKYVMKYGFSHFAADKRRKGHSSKNSGNASAETQASETQASSRLATATRKDSRGDDAQKQASRLPPHKTPLPARLEPLDVYDPSAMPTPLRLSRRRRRRGKALQKMEIIPEVCSPVPQPRRSPNMRDSYGSEVPFVHEAIAVRPGAAKLRARRVEVTGPRALRATREVLARV